jgi:hypothetical protein
MPEIDAIIGGVTRTTCDVQPLFGLNDIGPFLKEFPYQYELMEADTQRLFRMAISMMPLTLQVQDKRWKVEGGQLANGAVLVTYVPVIGAGRLPMQITGIALVPRK